LLLESIQTGRLAVLFKVYQTGIRDRAVVLRVDLAS